MYEAGVNDADSETGSEDDMKYESIVENRHEMASKCSGEIGTCSCVCNIAYYQ